MCLGIPAKVVEVRGEVGIVEFGGVRKEVDASLVDVEPGDYVIIHAGAMISRLSPKEAEETIKLWEEVIRKLDEANIS